MNTRLATLKRIEVLYGMVEEMHSAALRQAAARVHEAEAEIAEQCNQMHEAASDARHALVEGDRQQWILAGVQRTLGSMRRQQLEEIKRQREIVTEQSKAEYGASRMKNEQMKSVVEKSETVEQLVAGRKMQSVTDDRFLSRLRWNASRFGQI